MAGRRSGTPNYKNDILIAIIEELLPNGNLQWQTVAQRYMELSGELQLRSVDDLKKHWHFKLCNKLNKPTGRTGENGDRVLKCIRISNLITAKSDSMLLGVVESSDEEEDNGKDGDVSGEEEDDDEDDGDKKPAAIDDATIAAVVEDSLRTAHVPPPALPPMDIRGVNLFGAAASGAVSAGAAAANGFAAAAIGSAAAAATAGAAFPGTGSAAASSFKPKKVKSVNEKTKNSSNVVKDRFSIKKSIEKLTDAFCTPSVTPANIQPQPDGLVAYQNSLDRMVRNEIDRVINVHDGYVRDLKRRSRETNRMLKRLMKEFKNDKKKAKKAKSDEGKGSDGSISDDSSSSDSEFDE